MPGSNRQFVIQLTEQVPSAEPAADAASQPAAHVDRARLRGLQSQVHILREYELELLRDCDLVKRHIAEAMVDPSARLASRQLAGQLGRDRIHFVVATKPRSRTASATAATSAAAQTSPSRAHVRAQAPAIPSITLRLECSAAASPADSPSQLLRGSPQLRPPRRGRTASTASSSDRASVVDSASPALQRAHVSSSAEHPLYVTAIERPAEHEDAELVAAPPPPPVVAVDTAPAAVPLDALPLDAASPKRRQSLRGAHHAPATRENPTRPRGLEPTPHGESALLNGIGRKLAIGTESGHGKRRARSATDQQQQHRDPVFSSPTFQNPKRAKSATAVLQRSLHRRPSTILAVDAPPSTNDYGFCMTTHESVFQVFGVC